MDKKKILLALNKNLYYQFDEESSSYSWEDLIDDAEELTEEEKSWAKKNVGYKAYINE